MIQYKRVKEFQVEQIRRLFESVNWYSGRQPEKLQLAFQNCDLPGQVILHGLRHSLRHPITVIDCSGQLIEILI